MGDTETIDQLREENQRLQDMLDSAIQSLDAASAVRDVTEKARRELLDALQRARMEAEAAWKRREKVWAEVLSAEILARKAAEAALQAFVSGQMRLVKPDDTTK